MKILILCNKPVCDPLWFDNFLVGVWFDFAVTEVCGDDVRNTQPLVVVVVNSTMLHHQLPQLIT